MMQVKGKVLSVHAMKAYMGRSIGPLILHLRTRWRRVHNSAVLLPRKNPGMIERGLGGPQSQLGHFWRRQVSLVPTEI